MKKTAFSLLFAAMLVCLPCLAQDTTKAAAAGDDARFNGPIGLQLYTLRNIFSEDVDKGLDQAKAFGVTEVELAGTYGLEPEVFLKKLNDRGLKPIASLTGYDRICKETQAVVDECKALGVQYVGCAWIPHQGEFDEKQCRAVIAEFNRVGKIFAENGLKFFYHNHGYEFVPHGDGTLFDLLVTETDPRYVNFEMDTLWVVHPAQDPVALLKKYPDRWILMHLKDLRKGVPTGKLTGSEDTKNDVVLGTGQIDLQSILKEAQALGIKHYFIEDESPTPVQQVPQSIKYLESLTW